jgi:hypothetical protein
MRSKQIGATGITVLFIILLTHGISAAGAATIVVNDASDTLHGLGCAMSGMGTCTLRDATAFANANPGADEIHFQIPGPGVHIIKGGYSSTGDLTIDGYTQPGSKPNTNGPRLRDNALLLIVITGSLDLQGGQNTVRGLVIKGGIDISNNLSLHDLIEGNFIGTDATGSTGLGAGGIRAADDAFQVTIGGTSPESRNVIAGIVSMTADRGIEVVGNFIGINAAGNASLGAISAVNVFDCCTGSGNGPGTGGLIEITKNVISGGGGIATGEISRVEIRGNFIGTDVTGTFAVPNHGNGIAVLFDSQIGGPDPGDGNLISGNLGYGVFVGAGASIQNNLIGTDVSGLHPIGNGNGGIFVGGTFVLDAYIGGNVIAYNGFADRDGAGVAFEPSGSAGFDSCIITGNSIFENTSNGSIPDRGLGIDLGGDGPTPNDACDGDQFQNFPVLQNAITDGATVRIIGTLNSKPSAPYRVEFFANPSCDPSGYGEGKTFLGFVNVTMDSSCNAAFDVVLPAAVALGQFVTATATGVNKRNFFLSNTSEFSLCRQVAALQDVDGLVSLAPLTTTFNATPAVGGPAGTFLIKATFTNTSSTAIDRPVFQVKELSGGNLLLNADGGPGGVGARLTPNVGADNVLSPGETLITEFIVGLQRRTSFTFLVTLLGVTDP